MQYRNLGRSGLQVSSISMGCMAIADAAYWGPQDEGAALAAIRTAYDCGVNSFDTAEAYGDGYSEELLGRALAGVRQRVLIASKVAQGHLRPAELRAACEASLRRLQTDYLDVYYIHWPNPDVPIAETMATLEQLRAEGKVRVLACSNFGRRDLAELLRCGRVEANELPYNLLWRAIEYEIVPLCVENEIGITCYSPLLQGLLTGRFRTAGDFPAERARTRHFSGRRPAARHGEPGAEAETFAALDEIRAIADGAGLPLAEMALAWLLTRPGVSSVIAGARNPEQMRANLRAADLRLPADVTAALTGATDPLKQKLGRNADPWQSDSRIR